MVKMKLTNLIDVQNAKAGLILESQVRSLEIEALADTGAINMAIPEDVAESLGAPVVRRQRVQVADGRSLEVPVVGGLLVEVNGRGAGGDAIVLPKGATPLLGTVQLEIMDFVVVPSTGEVVPNPAHPDGPIVPMPCAA